MCNGCSKRTNCMMDKKIYSSKYAQDTYEALRTTSREGINQTPESIQKLDILLSPLLKKGQSIAHIYASHADEIACSRRTIYSYIDRKDHRSHEPENQPHGQCCDRLLQQDERCAGAAARR